MKLSKYKIVNCSYVMKIYILINPNDSARTQVEPNTYALIMSLECATSGYYLGDDKSKLLSNCLFRMGGSALLLSNRPSDRRISKYELSLTLRTHRAADDRSYKCVFQEPDKEGALGITISKDPLRRRRSPQGQHHLPGPTRAPHLRETHVPRNAHWPKISQHERASPIRAGFQGGVRAFLHPCGREGGAGRGGDEFEAESVGYGAVEDDAL